MNKDKNWGLILAIILVTVIPIIIGINFLYLTILTWDNLTIPEIAYFTLLVAILMFVIGAKVGLMGYIDYKEYLENAND